MVNILNTVSRLVYRCAEVVFILRRTEILKYYLENYQSSNTGLSNPGSFMSLKHIIVIIIFQVLRKLFEYHKSRTIVLFLLLFLE